MHKIESLLVPQKSTNRKVRFGPRSDAGYVVIDGVFNSTTPLISFGVGDNIEFETEVGSRYNTPVVCYDQEPQGYFLRKYPTIESAPIGSSHVITPNVTYKKLHATKETIVNIIPKQGSYILKMDIEGAEWEVIRSLTDDDMSRAQMIVIEYHLGLQYRQTGSIDSLVDVFEKINKTHTLVHVHGNNYEPFYVNGTRLPSVLECCYVSKTSGLNNSEIDLGEYPIIGIDAPNNPYAADLSLDWWKTKE